MAPYRTGERVMTASNLVLDYTALLREIGSYIGIGRDQTGYSADQISEIEAIIDRGYRQFIAPPVLKGENLPHVWSFLCPAATLNTIVEYETGTVAVTDDSTTVTLTGGAWPSWISSDAVLTIAGTEYGIASRTSTTVIVLETAWSAGTDASASYSIHYHPSVHNLPDDFGSIMGGFTYEDAALYQPVPIIGEAQIAGMHARRSSATGKPQYACIRPTPHRNYATGTVALTQNATTVTLTGGTFPTWVDYNSVLIIDSTEYAISSRESTTELRLGTPWAAASDATASYAVESHAAGVVFEVRFWPTLDDDYTMYYRYRMEVGRVTSSATYIIGTMEHTETVLQSCLAIAERYAGKTTGVEYAAFMGRLKASVLLDRHTQQPDFIGYIGDSSESGPTSRARPDHNVTVNDVLYP